MSIWSTLFLLPPGNNCELKKTHHLQVRVMFYLLNETEDLGSGHSISDNSERLLRRGKRGGPGYIGVFATKTRYSGHYCKRKTRDLELTNLAFF